MKLQMLHCYMSYTTLASGKFDQFMGAMCKKFGEVSLTPRFSGVAESTETNLTVSTVFRAM